MHSVMNRLRDGCLSNLDRLRSEECTDSWKLVSIHLLKLCSNSDVVSRGQATEVLTAVLRTMIESSPIDSNVVNALHEKVFTILELMTDVNWVDVQKSSLLTQKTIIESSGQHLSEHVWRLIIRVTAQLVPETAQTKSLDTLKLGFQILQLISNEFLMHLDIQGLVKYIETMGVYGSGVQDLNINLGAIGLLWNVADFLSSQRHRESRDPWDLSVTDSLYVDLLSQLAKLSENGHPDVRNGAAHTLFRAFIVHGRNFQQRTLRSSFDQIMYPLMEMVMGSCPEISIGLLSKERERSPLQGDKDVRLSIHHSKESLQKQWEETQVLVATGIAKLFEEYMIQLASFKDILDIWKVYMTLILYLIQSDSKEIIVGTTDAFCNVLNMNIDKELLIEQQPYLEILWNEAFSTWKSIAKNIFVAKTDLREWTEKAIVSLVSCFRGIHALLTLEVSISDLQIVFDLFYHCILVKSQDGFHDSAGMSSVQKTVLEIMEEIQISEERVSPIILHYLRLCKLPFSPRNSVKMNMANETKYENHQHSFLALSRVAIRRVHPIFIGHSNASFLYTSETFQSCVKVRLMT
jgi:hypothetical protein